MKKPSEKPILFNADMVRAILDGRKTQTRREIKPQPTKLAGPNFDGCWSDTIDPVVRYFRCQFGTIGSRLWVKETWRCFGGREYEYQKHQPSVMYRAETRYDYVEHAAEYLQADWRPSIHMPRWASRITLEITNIRVERLQDISEEDAENEGVAFMRDIPDADETLSANTLFQILWESIYSESSWAKNPYIWAITFKKL